MHVTWHTHNSSHAASTQACTGMKHGIKRRQVCHAPLQLYRQQLSRPKIRKRQFRGNVSLVLPVHEPHTQCAGVSSSPSFERTEIHNPQSTHYWMQLGCARAGPAPVKSQQFSPQNVYAGPKPAGAKDRPRTSIMTSEWVALK